MKKDQWINNAQNLYHILDVVGDKYTIHVFMKYVFNTLFIDINKPKRKLNWSKDSMGLQNISEDNKKFIKYIFDAHKIFFENLNED